MNLFGLRTLSRESDSKRIGWAVDIIPEFKSVLFDDITQRVYKKLNDGGQDCIGVFSYDSAVFEQGKGARVAFTK